MTSSKPPSATPDRDAKLAAALRANLRRRKASASAAPKPLAPKSEEKS